MFLLEHAWGDVTESALLSSWLLVECEGGRGEGGRGEGVRGEVVRVGEVGEGDLKHPESLDFLVSF